MSLARTAVAQKSPQHVCVKIYMFPQEIKNEIRLEPLKRKMKNYLTKLSPYKLEEFFVTN